MDEARFKILKALHGRPTMSLPQINDRLEHEERQLKYHISILQDDGHIVSEKDGHYRITAHGEKKLRRCRISSQIGFDVEPD